jgi:sulfide:quinone oxidoreductase
MTTASQTILILGGGVGGVATAVLLRERLGEAHRIVLIEREAAYVFAPSLLWLLTGDRAPEAISRPMDRLAGRGVEVVRGEVEAIDAASRTVTVSGKAIAADWLVVALGADLAPDAVPGLAEAGHNLYTLAGATAFRDAFARFEGGRIALLTATPAYKCPAAPYEAAMLIESALRKRGIRERTQVDLYTAEPGPMGVTGAENSAAVRQMVEQHGVTYHPEHVTARVERGGVRFTNGTSAAFDLLGYVPPHRPPGAVRESALAGEGGWVSVNRNTMETAFPNVFAIGDVTSIPLAMGRPLPRAGVFAHAQAEAVVKTIGRAITGRGKAGTFDGHGECFIETGDSKAGFGKGNFYAEPRPQIAMSMPGWHWHAGKVAFEKYWLRRWF